MSDDPVHDWILPRLRALVAEAEQAGFERQVVVAVIADLATGPTFNDAPPAIDTKMHP